jgi:ATP-dependent RNA helicase RhlB
MKFHEFDFDQRILKGIDEAAFEECTPVQEKSFDASLKMRDLMVQSQTGTGKTAAFLISIFQLFLTDRIEKKQVLIIVPTRELAVQIEEEAKMLGKHLPFTYGSFFGGVGYGHQIKHLKEGVNFIIGTPGRLLDLGNSGKLNFREISVLIIDEADRLFDMGFIPDLRKMLRKMPPREERLNMLFSATLSSRVKQLAWEYMNNPVEIEIEPEQVTVDEITQILYHVSKEEKFKLLLGVLKKHNPATALVFTNTKHAAVKVSHRLNHNGYSSQYIMGDLPQRKRLAIIEKIKSGELKFLVATDVAARGLHINDLAMVINYDLPEDYENYVHRIGRTARAGKTGIAVSMACEKYVYGLEAIESFIDTKIPVEWADDALFPQDHSIGKYIPDDRATTRQKSSSPRHSSGRSSARGTGKPQGRRTGTAASGSRSNRSNQGYRKDQRQEDNKRIQEDNKKIQARVESRKTEARRPEERKKHTPRVNHKPAGPKRGERAVGRDRGIEERLAYYRKKYDKNQK